MRESFLINCYFMNLIFCFSSNKRFTNRSANQIMEVKRWSRTLSLNYSLKSLLFCYVCSSFIRKYYSGYQSIESWEPLIIITANKQSNLFCSWMCCFNLISFQRIISIFNVSCCLFFNARISIIDISPNSFYVRGRREIFGDGGFLSLNITGLELIITLS